MNVTNGDKDQSIEDYVSANGSEPHDDSAFGKPRKYLPIKKKVVIDGKKMVEEGANASQGQCDDNADDWLPAINSHAANKEHGNDTELPDLIYENSDELPVEEHNIEQNEA
ncbi:hypothetical protein Tco_0813767 [Tanacetum coccineum]